ncbi:LamG-like jellyroll fold domain-containing protein [Thomasclavelia spiroformis]|uniref:LamG-like jellyroll fold domain-containing protein n=2 Tax=Thomasclavelia spiroformis TaxID=29348 RepID=UPI00174E5012|nr:LamG-like jellyroll fold domain-containing protein [Thomasclavelia spiroformis]
MLGGSYRQLVSTVKVRQWYHIVGVVDGKEVKLYVNGQLQSTVTAPNPGIKYPSSSGAWNMVLGADSDSSNGAQAYTNADLSFARIYSNALSDDDIAYLSDKAFTGADIEELKPQDINLGLIGSEGISENGQWNLNIHANEVKVGSIDKIEYDLVYDSDALNYEGVQHKMSGVTILEEEKGRLHIVSSATLSTNDFNIYATTRLGKLNFTTGDVTDTKTVTIKTENFKAYAQGKDVTASMTNYPQASKDLKIYSQEKFDLNGDGVIGAGDIALASDDLKDDIASQANIYPYKHVVILTVDGAGTVWDPEYMYYTTSNSILPTKQNSPEVLAKRKNVYAMDLLNKEFATSYSAQAVTPSISAQNYSSILHGVPWKDVPFEYQVTNDIAGQKYYADFNKEIAKYPSIFKAVNSAFPSRQNAAFAEWTQILNGIIEPDAQVISKGSASKESFYDVANYIKTDDFKNTAVVYMQSDWMDHVGHSTGYYNDTYWAELEQYDDYYKAVVDALKETGEYDETLIITNADHGGNAYNHGSSDPSNMDIFIGIGGQTVDSGKKLTGGNNADISPIALDALRINKPTSMTGEVFDQSAFLSQDEMSKKNRDIENIKMEVAGKSATLTLENPKSETRVIDAVIDLNGQNITSITPNGGTILRQSIEDDQLKLTISYTGQPTTLATINFEKESSTPAKLSEIMLGDESGNEIYPGIENNAVTSLTNKRHLQIAVELANQVTEEQLDKVVPVVVAEFKAALQEAKEILENKTALQSDIDASFERLVSVMQKLEFFKGNKDIIEAFIKQVSNLEENKYSQTTWLEFTKALNEANILINNENALQYEVDEAYTNLVTAFLNLRLIPNKDLLQNLINQANNYIQTNYTAASWNVFKNELENAKITLNNPDANQQEIDNAVTALTNAIANLQTIDATVNKVNNIDTAPSVKTGDNNAITIFVTLSLLSAAGYLSLKRKRK